MKTVPGRQYHIPHLVISPVWKMIHVCFSFLIFCFQCYLVISTLKYYVTVFYVTLPSSTDSSIPPHSWCIQVTILGEVNNEHCLLSDHVTVLRVESHSSWPCAFLQGPSAYLMNRGTGGLCSRWSFQGCTYVVNSLGRYQWCFSPGQKTSLYTV